MEGIGPAIRRCSSSIRIRIYRGNLSWAWVGQADGQPYNAIVVPTRQQGTKPYSSSSSASSKRVARQRVSMMLVCSMTKKRAESRS
ncbi:hypothetical protein FJ934_06920 [Mesorhizobium sp. B2-4-12]|nr:hypothetical protein FJ934_06920 [Mesorhizobium sp. B2-4-12]